MNPAALLTEPEHRTLIPEAHVWTLMTSLIWLAGAQDNPPEKLELPAWAQPTIEVGPIRFERTIDAPPPPLSFDVCIAPSVVDRGPVTLPVDGRVLLQIKLRRGKAALVTAAEVAAGLEWLTPCLSRELAAVEWPVRRGTAQIPVHVSHRVADHPPILPLPTR